MGDESLFFFFFFFARVGDGCTDYGVVLQKAALLVIGCEFTGLG
jgi:hypothetical protein